MELQWKQGLKFLLGIVLIGGFLYYIFFNLIDFNYLQLLVAWLSSTSLNLIGIQSSVLVMHPPTIVAGALEADIIRLCVGDLEIAVLVAAILSTLDRKVIGRVSGAFVGIFFIFIINTLRVTATMAAGVWFGLDVMDIFHTLFFRVTLVVSILVFYVVWYRWEDIKRRIEKVV